MRSSAELSPLRYARQAAQQAWPARAQQALAVPPRRWRTAAGAGSMTAGDAAGVGAGVAAAGADGSSRITGEDSCPPSHSLLSGKPIAARTTTTAAAAPSVPSRLRPAAGTFGITGGCCGRARLWRRPRNGLGPCRPRGLRFGNGSLVFNPGFRHCLRRNRRSGLLSPDANLRRLRKALEDRRCRRGCGGRRRRSCHGSSYDCRSDRRRHRYDGCISNGRWLCRKSNRRRKNYSGLDIRRYARRFRTARARCCRTGYGTHSCT